MPRLTALVVLAAAGGALTGATAVGQPRGPEAAKLPIARAAVFTLELEGDAAPELRRAVAKGVADGLSGAGVEVLSFDDASALLATRPELAGCSSTACLSELGALLAASHLVRARIDARGADYTIMLELVAISDGGVSRRVDAACPVCTVADLTQRTAGAARELASAGAAVTVDVLVASSPDGATLQLDGAVVGTTPFATRLPAGRHTVRVELRGRDPSERVIEVVAAGEGPQRFELLLAQAVQPPAERPLRIWKWAAAGGALVALGAGVTLLAADGHGSCDGPGACERLYDTGAAGWVSLAIGAGLGGAAGWMFFRDHGSQREAALAIGPGSAALRVTF